MNSEEVQVKKKQQGVTAKHFYPHVKITPGKAFHFSNGARISPRHFLTKCSRYHVFITRRSSINSQQTCFNLLRVSASTSTASLCVSEQRCTVYISLALLCQTLLSDALQQNSTLF